MGAWDTQQAVATGAQISQEICTLIPREMLLDSPKAVKYFSRSNHYAANGWNFMIKSAMLSWSFIDLPEESNHVIAVYGAE